MSNLLQDIIDKYSSAPADSSKQSKGTPTSVPADSKMFQRSLVQDVGAAFHNAVAASSEPQETYSWFIHNGTSTPTSVSTTYNPPFRGPSGKKNILPMAQDAELTELKLTLLGIGSKHTYVSRVRGVYHLKEVNIPERVFLTETRQQIEYTRQGRDHAGVLPEQILATLEHYLSLHNTSAEITQAIKHLGYAKAFIEKDVLNQQRATHGNDEQSQ